MPSARRGDDAARSAWRATLTSNFTFLSATVGFKWFKCFRDAPADRLLGAGMVPPSAVPRQQRCSAQDTLIIPTGAGNRPPEVALQASLSLTKRARRSAEPVHAAYAIEA